MQRMVRMGRMLRVLRMQKESRMLRICRPVPGPRDAQEDIKDDEGLQAALDFVEGKTLRSCGTSISCFKPSWPGSSIAIQLIIAGTFLYQQ